MSSIKLEITVNFESWFDKDIEPKTKEQWAEYFMSHFFSEGSVIGTDDDEGCKLLALDSYQVEVLEIR